MTGNQQDPAPETSRAQFLRAAGDLKEAFGDVRDEIGYDAKQAARSAYKTLTELATYIPDTPPGSPLPYGGMTDKDIALAVRQAELGLASPSVTLDLVRELRGLRAELHALGGPHGVTDETIRSVIAEGFHTAFRKADDSVNAAIAWKAIRDMADDDPEAWTAILDFTVNPLIAMLREAEAGSQAGEAGVEGAT